MEWPHPLLRTLSISLWCISKLGPELQSFLKLRSPYVTSTPGHVLTTSLLRPKKIKDVVRTWYGLVGRGRNVVRT